MRYPLWAFFFVLVLPPFAGHALLTGKAEIVAPSQVADTLAPIPAGPWRHTVITR